MVDCGFKERNTQQHEQSSKDYAKVLFKPKFMK